MSVVACALAFGLAATSSGQTEKTYRIDLDRTANVGQRFAIAVKAEVLHRVRLMDQPHIRQPPDEKYTAELTGTEVIECLNNTNDGPTRLRVTVGKLTKDGAELLPPGTVILADHAGRVAAFTVNGVVANRQMSDVLAAVIHTTANGRKFSTNAQWGTTVPQPVGGTWTGDRAKMSATMTDYAPVTADHITATAKLESVKVVGGRLAQEILLAVEADPLEAGKVIGGLTVADGAYTGAFKVTLTADGTGPPCLISDDHTVLKVKGTSRDFGVRVESEREWTVHRTMAEAK